MDEDQIEIGVLWKKRSMKGDDYFTGKIKMDTGYVQVVMFPIISDNPKAPFFKIIESTNYASKREHPADITEST